MTGSSKDIQLSELEDMILQLNMAIKTLNETIARQQSENDNLTTELAWFCPKLFGSSSERRVDNMAGQQSLFEKLIGSLQQDWSTCSPCMIIFTENIWNGDSWWWTRHPSRYWKRKGAERSRSLISGWTEPEKMAWIPSFSIITRLPGQEKTPDSF